MQFERLYHELSAHVATTFLVVPRHGARGRFLPVKEPADLAEIAAAPARDARCAARSPGARRLAARASGTDSARSRHASGHGSVLYRRSGAAPRPRPPAPVRRLRPGRRVGLRALPRAARAMRAAVLRALRGAGAVARSPLRRVQRPAAGVRKRARRARLRGRRPRVRRPRGRSAADVTWRPSPPSSSSTRCRGRPWMSISFVPGDRDRGLARGHAPAAALASELSAAWSIPVAALLRRRPGVERQRGLPRAERRQERGTRVLRPRRVAGAASASSTTSTRRARRRRRARRPSVEQERGGSRSSAWRGPCDSRMRSSHRRRETEERHAAQAHRPSRQPERRHPAVRGGEALEARSAAPRPDAGRGHVLTRAQSLDRRRPHRRGGRPHEGPEPRRAASRRRPTRRRSTSSWTSSSARSRSIARSAPSRRAGAHRTAARLSLPRI